MPVMNEAQRRELWVRWQEANTETFTAAVSDKNVLRTCVDNIDDYRVNTMEAGVVGALPAAAQPGNGGLSKAQIALVMELMINIVYREGL